MRTLEKKQIVLGDRLAVWLKKLSKLRVDRASKTPAPHKPILLLAILDLIEEEIIGSNEIRLTAELAFRFLSYWEVIGARGRNVGRVELPFYYLRSDGFFRHIAYPGLDAALDCIKPTSVDLLNRIIAYAEMPEEFFELMKNQDNRKMARQVLISGSWFSQVERNIFRNILGISFPALPAEEELISHSADEGRKQGRDIKFRLQIVPLYRYSCALCGVKILLPSGITLVEAAHIHQFSQSRNDDVSNGMALCRNHHWAFDQGIWTLGNNYEVLVASGKFLEDTTSQLILSQHHLRRLDFSWLHLSQRPDQECLGWHRKHKFLGSPEE